MVRSVRSVISVAVKPRQQTQQTVPEGWAWVWFTSEPQQRACDTCSMNTC